ncbi:MAG: TonB-dependent receptor [Bacteroidota bacterium]
MKDGVYTLENLLTYEKTFASKHRVSFTGLYSIQEDHSHNTSVSKDSIDEDFVQFYNLGQASTSSNTRAVVNGSETSWALISYMARLNYVYDDKYMITLTGRIDGSSRLAEGNKWHQYPAVSLGWNISNESFMKDIGFISSLKLRAGWGETSNQSINPYASLGNVSPSNGLNTTASGSQGPGGSIRYNYGPTRIVTGYNITSLPNPDLDWEYTRVTNIGLDFGVLKNRITGSLELYKAHTYKILYGLTLPATSGITSQYTTNIGEMENKGVELTLSTVNLRLKNGFTWTTDFNVFFNRNKLLKLNDGFDKNIGNQLFVGQPLTAIYDYQNWASGK